VPLHAALNFITASSPGPQRDEGSMLGPPRTTRLVFQATTELRTPLEHPNVAVVRNFVRTGVPAEFCTA
jgi:hypothetical protein